MFFDAKTAIAVPKTVIPEEDQEDYESRKYVEAMNRQDDSPSFHRLWSKLTDAIKRRDMEGATDAKTAVEDHQRQLAKERDASGWKPRFFEEDYDDYRLKALKK